MKLSTAYISHPNYFKHEMEPGHPECPQRLVVIAAQLQVSGFMNQLECHEAPLTTFEQLARVHTTCYIESVQQASPTSGLAYYPHSGADRCRRNMVNVPLPVGTDSVAFRKAITG